MAVLGLAKVNSRALLEETQGCKEQWLGYFQSLRDLIRSEIAGMVSCKERVKAAPAVSAEVISLRFKDFVEYTEMLTQIR